MSSEKLMNKSNDNEEEDELIRLRMAALESMHNKSNKNKEHTNSSSNNNNDVKVNQISDYKTRHLNNNNNYYSRNASKRSNLIVLTASETEFIPKNTSNSKRETFFTQLIQKSSNESPELSSKRKRVLPGRFSRLEREDNTDEESEEYSDDNEDSIHLNNNSNDMLSAFNEELCTESDNTITDVLLDTDHNLNKNGLNKEIENSITSNPNVCTNTVNNYNNSFNIESNNEMTSSNEELDKSMCSASTSTKVINNYTKLNSESKKDMIKLNITNNKISGSDILERRKQKFGDSATHEMITDFDNSSQSSENANNHIINSINTNNKLSIKNRLSVNSIENEKNVYSKTCRHRNDSKHSNIKGIEKSCGYNTRLNREIDSETEQDFDDNHSTKKKLRSLVVMKTE